jgi:hypothetical protein
MSDKWFQHTTQNNQRQQDWKNLPRFNKIARTMYPNLVDADTKRAMASLSANEGKRPPQQPKLLSDKERSYQSPLGGQSVRSK